MIERVMHVIIPQKSGVSLFCGIGVRTYFRDTEMSHGRAYHRGGLFNYLANLMVRAVTTPQTQLKNNTNNGV